MLHDLSKLAIETIHWKLGENKLLVGKKMIRDMDACWVITNMMMNIKIN